MEVFYLKLNARTLIGVLAMSFVTSQPGTDEDPVYSACGGEIYTNRGVITSPNYPNDYSNNLLCSWRINTRAEVKVEISFDALDIENSRNCQYDHLSVQFRGEVEQKSCGDSAETTPVEGYMPAVVKFSSDGSVAGDGFSLTFQVISPCLSDPCQNGATCDYEPDSYTCECTDGWEGTNCEINIDECVSTPCQNGGSCNDEVGGFVCACISGYSGPTCEVIIDYCLLFSPCQNGGTCRNTNQTYQCDCVVGYAGTNCEREIDECSSSPCFNGGICEDNFNQYNCVCLEGYSGINCQYSPTTTTQTPPMPISTTTTTAFADFTLTSEVGLLCTEFECLNGGSCVILNQFSEACLCLDGFEGARCQNDSNYSGYFIAMIVATLVSVVCVLLLAAILCYLLHKRSQDDNVENIALFQRENKDHEGPGRQRGSKLSHPNSERKGRSTESKGIEPITAPGMENAGFIQDLTLPHQIKESSDIQRPYFQHARSQGAPNNNISLEALISVCNLLNAKPKTNIETDARIPSDALAALLQHMSHRTKTTPTTQSKETPSMNTNSVPKHANEAYGNFSKANKQKFLPGFRKTPKQDFPKSVSQFQYYKYVDQFRKDSKGRAFVQLTRENAFIVE